MEWAERGSKRAESGWRVSGEWIWNGRRTEDGGRYLYASKYACTVLCVGAFYKKEGERARAKNTTTHVLPAYPHDPPFSFLPSATGR